MLSSRSRFLLLSLTFLLLGGLLAFLAFDRGSARILGMAVVFLVLSAGAFVAGTFSALGPGDPLERRRQQRLWKSGPLGRKWLEGRRRIP